MVHSISRWSPFLAPLTACLLASLSTGCKTRSRDLNLQLFEAQQPHMGTLFTISLYAPDKESANRAAKAAFARVAKLNRIMSDYEQESEIRRLVREPIGVPVKISGDLMQVLLHSRDLARQTDSDFDVTIGPLIRYWRRARRQRTLPDPERLAQVRPSVGYQKLKLDPANSTATLLAPDMFLDLGGVAKGYAADQALAELKKHGVHRALVAASGDIRVGDPPPGKNGWTVDIASIDASNADERTDTLLLRNAAVSTSGDTEQYVPINGIRYSHIVDPRTGHGLRKRIGVTVVAEDATTTDSFATAISVMGAERGLALIKATPGTHALIVEKDDQSLTRVASPDYHRLPRPPTQARPDH